MRALIYSLFLLAVLPWMLRADGEQIILSGGPALRFFERGKENSHDKFWGNFIESATVRIKQIQAELPADQHLTWLVFRPAYERRGKEEKLDLVSAVNARAQLLGVSLIWFNDRDELIRYFNKRDSSLPITRLEYFGHSNRRTFLFDYSNRVDGAALEPLVLHIEDLKRISAKAFAPGAYCQSWGCHSGEEYSGYWREALGIPMVGAVGKTDYSNGGIPFLSTPDGKWSE